MDEVGPCGGSNGFDGRPQFLRPCLQSASWLQIQVDAGIRRQKLAAPPAAQRIFVQYLTTILFETLLAS